MQITGLNAYKGHGAPVAHAFFVAPGNKFWEVTLFYGHVPILVRRWGKFGSRRPGLVRFLSNQFRAQREFERVTTEKRYQRWTQVNDSTIDQLAAIMILAQPANPSIPNARYRHRPADRNCRCDAYGFPHRATGGSCTALWETDNYDGRRG